MKCFYHETAEAVGLCSQCGKAACRWCIADVGGSMLCTSCLQMRGQQIQAQQQNDAQKANIRIYISYAFAGLGLMIGGIVGMSDSAPGSAGSRVLLVAFDGLLGTYVVWATYWGWPVAWGFWRGLFKKIGFLFSRTPWVGCYS